MFASSSLTSNEHDHDPADNDNISFLKVTATTINEVSFSSAEPTVLYDQYIS